MVMCCIAFKLNESGVGFFEGERADGDQPGGRAQEGGLLGGGQLERDRGARHRRRDRSHPTRRQQPHGTRGREASRFLRHADRDSQEHPPCHGGGSGPESAAEHDPHGRGAAGEGRALVIFEAEDGSVRVGEQTQQVPVMICVAQFHPHLTSGRAWHHQQAEWISSPLEKQKDKGKRGTLLPRTIIAYKLLLACRLWGVLDDQESPNPSPWALQCVGGGVWVRALFTQNFVILDDVQIQILKSQFLMSRQLTELLLRLAQQEVRGEQVAACEKSRALSSSQILNRIYSTMNSEGNYRMQRSHKQSLCSEQTTPQSPLKCNCKKSKCLKLYCECFARGSFCQGCNCDCCHNTPAFGDARAKAIDDMLSKAAVPFGHRSSFGKGCNCKKTGCQKKYCECFNQGMPCGEHCKCSNCANCSLESD